jgi:Apea-like HEPN
VTETSTPTAPADSDLWDLTRAAVRAAGEAADAYLTPNGWRPRVAVASVGAFDSGWPNLTSHRWLPRDDAPTNFSALFGPQRDQLKPIAFSDVPELAALIAFVRGRDDLCARLTMSSASGKEDVERRMFEYEVTDLPLSLLDRARATSASSDDQLLALYCERERAWLLDPLPVEYVVPFALTAFDLGSTMVISTTARIEPLDEGTQSARAPSSSSHGSVPDAVLGAATHALVLSGYQMPNPGPALRMFSQEVEPLPLDDADLICEALRVLTHVDIGYAQILRRPVGWADRWKYDLPPIDTVETLRRYPDSFDRYGWLRDPNPIPAATLMQLPTVLSSLRSAPSRIRLASRRLTTATLRIVDDDRTVEACIGIEALLGEGRDELSHRMALRAATALAASENPADPHVIYNLVKKVYAHRSAVVHGTEGGKSRQITFKGATYGADGIAVILLRELLLDVLTRPGGWTPQSLDADLLNSLAPAEQKDDDEA